MTYHATDVIVVGGGIVGLAAAVACAERGAAVMVIDPANGRGASESSTGIIVPPTGRRAHGPLGVVCQAAWESLPHWIAALESQTHMSLELQRVAAWRLVEAPRTLQPGQAWLSRDTVRAALPALRQQAIGAIVVPQAGHLNPASVRTALHARLAHLRGVHVHDEVVRVCYDNRGVRGVLMADGGDVRATWTVVAAGIATVSVLAPLGVCLPLHGDVGQIVQLHAVPTPSQVLLLGQITVVGKQDGSVWLTGIHHPGETVARVRTADTNRLRTAAMDLWGSRGRLGHVWAGVRPKAPGGIPWIGPWPGYPGLIVAAGHGSNGYLLAPITGSAIAAVVCDATFPSVLDSCLPTARMHALIPEASPAA